AAAVDRDAAAGGAADTAFGMAVADAAAVGFGPDRRKMYPTAGTEEIVPGTSPPTPTSSFRRRWLMWERSAFASPPALPHTYVYKRLAGTTLSALVARRYRIRNSVGVRRTLASRQPTSYVCGSSVNPSS